LAQHQVAQEAARQQCEGAGRKASADVKALHGFAVSGDVAPGQEPEGQHQHAVHHRNQQVDQRETVDVGQAEITDEDGRGGGYQHQRDPSVAKSAVQAGPLGAAAAGPQRHRAAGDRAQGGTDVDGDGG